MQFRFLLLFLVAASSLAQPPLDLERARQQLIERGYSPGPVSRSLTPEMKRAISLFQKEQGLATTGELDAATRSALGITPAIHSQIARIRLSSESRAELNAALREIEALGAKLSRVNQKSALQAVGSARHRIAKDRYYGGIAEVLKAKHDLDLAEMAIEENRENAARRELMTARAELRTLLTAK